MNMTGATAGAKRRDYFFTVLAVDPLAIPLTRWLARVGVGPTPVSWLSIALGVPIVFAFGTAERWGLVVGAVLWYLSFLLDCIDGKLARMTGKTSEKGRLLDSLGDGARRGSSVLGMVSYLWQTEGWTEAWVAMIFGIVAFYVIELSGGEMSGVSQEPKGAWATALARHRLLPLPGMTDVSAIAFVIGPLTGFAFEGVVVGLVLASAAVLRKYAGALR